MHDPVTGCPWRVSLYVFAVIALVFALMLGVQCLPQTAKGWHSMQNPIWRDPDHRWNEAWR